MDMIRAHCGKIENIDEWEKENGSYFSLTPFQYTTINRKPL